MWRPTLDAHDASLKEAAAACAQWVAEVAAGRAPRWLTLTGVCGCGKTMLAQQIFDEASKYNPGNKGLWIPRDEGYSDGDRRPRNVALTASKFGQLMMAGEYDLPEYLADDFLVLLDDLGASRDKTQFQADALYRLYNQRQGKWTITTTNLRLREISEKVDERVASRLIRDGNQLVTITAPDYGIYKA